MNEATSLVRFTRTKALLRDRRGSTGGSYAGVATVVGVVGLASVLMLGSSMVTAVHENTQSTPPEVDSTAFISTHDPTYQLGSVSLGSSDDESDGSGDGSDTDLSSEDPALDAYNDCLVQGGTPEECEALHLGETDVVTTEETPATDTEATDDGFAEENSDSTGGGANDLGSSGQGAEVPYNNGGGGGGLGGLFGGVRDFLGNTNLPDLAGKVAGTVGKGFLGVLAGVGGAVLEGVPGLVTGKGFSGFQSGWSNGWSACQTDWSSVGCLGRSVVGVASIAGAGYLAGATLGAVGAVAGATAKFALLGAAFHFTDMDVLSSAVRLDFKGVGRAYAENFGECGANPGGCVVGIALNGAFAAFGGPIARTLIGKPIVRFANRMGWNWVGRMPLLRGSAARLQASHASGMARANAQVARYTPGNATSVPVSVTQVPGGYAQTVTLGAPTNRVYRLGQSLINEESAVAQGFGRILTRVGEVPQRLALRRTGMIANRGAARTGVLRRHRILDAAGSPVRAPANMTYNASTRELTKYLPDAYRSGAVNAWTPFSGNGVIAATGNRAASATERAALGSLGVVGTVGAIDVAGRTATDAFMARQAALTNQQAVPGYGQQVAPGYGQQVAPGYQAYPVQPYALQPANP